MQKIVTITGPSCAGKTTLVRELLKTGHFCEIVSFTSRAPRVGEINGIDYYFKEEKECDGILLSGLAVEYTRFKGNAYGIELSEIITKLASGKIPLSIVEPHGLEQIQEVFKDRVYSVYVGAPLELLYERFLERFSKEILECSPKVLDIKYHASRLRSIQEEWESWMEECQCNFYIDPFTSENKESIINSLIEILLVEKKGSDKN